MKGDTIPPLSHDAVPSLPPLSLVHSLSLFLSFLYTCFRFGSLLAFPLFFQPNATTINNPTL